MLTFCLRTLAVVVGFLSLLTFVLGQFVCDTSSRKYVINPDAKIHIGVILPVRELDQSGSGCGDVLTSGIQQLEAMKWILAVLNQDSGRIANRTITDSYIPGTKIGMTIEDSCSSEFGSLYSAVDLNQQFISTNRSCTGRTSRYDIGMIIGTTGNATITLASLLSTRQIPLISYADASTRLDDVTKYPYLLRAIPDYKYLVETILKIVDTLRWEAISVIHSNESEARDMMSELLRLAAFRERSCVVKVIEVKTKEQRVYYKDVVSTLLLSNVTGTVYVGDVDGLLAIFDTMELVRRAGQLQYIASPTSGNTRRLLERTYAKGLIIVSPSSRYLPEFAEYWEAIKPEDSVQDNPTYADWYMATRNCRLPGMSDGKFSVLPVCESATQKSNVQSKQDMLIERAIVAVYSYAKAMKNAHLDLCKGTSGLCPSLVSLRSDHFFKQYLRSLNFTFSDEERVPSLATREPGVYLSSARQVAVSKAGEFVGARYDISTINDVLGFADIHKIGYYDGYKLNLLPSDFIFYDMTRQDILYEIPSSSCQNERCSKCLAGTAPDQKPSSDYLYYPGTVIIAATMAIHHQGSDALSCGNINGFEGVQFAEAFVYILNQINSADIFPRWITLGGVVVDDCASSERALAELADLENGKTAIINVDGKSLDSNTILAYVSGYDDAILKAVGRLSSALSRPLLSYRSPSSIILDATAYKYVAEVVPDISKQVDVLVSFLTQMQWTYIQVLYSNDEYGKDALSVFRKKTFHYKICIGSSHSVTLSTDIKLKLKSKQRSKVVVTFLPSDYYVHLVRFLNKTGIYRRFLFLTDLNWPRASDVIKKYPEATHGFITLSMKDGASAGFLSHLRKIQPSNYTTNPWLKEWYEAMNDCALSKTIRGRFATRCAEIPITESKAFRLNDWTIYVMNAVYSVAWGLDATLRYYCGPGYNHLCMSYLEAKNRSEVLFRNILDVWFNDDTMTPHHFTNRSGNRPIIIRNINNGISVKIAEYNFGTSSFHIRKSAIVNYMESLVLPGCTGLCTDCVYLSHVRDDVVYMSGDLILGAVFNVHEAGSGPFDCSLQVSGEAVQLVEAMRLAISEVNSGIAAVKLNGIQLGAVILDGCHSDLRSADVISNVHFGLLDIKNDNTKLDVDSVLSWMTEDVPYTKVVLQTLGLVHTLLQGSGDINNGLISMAPLYPSEHLMNLLFMILRELNVTYTNLISSSSEGFAATLEGSLVRRGICVTKLIYTDTVSPAELIRSIRSKQSLVAVLYLDISSVVKILQARQFVDGDSDVFFIFLPKTSDDLRNIPSSLLKQTLVLEQLTPYIDDFDDLLDSRPVPSPFNPWLQDYYEELYSCKLERGYPYNETCKVRLPITSSETYKQSHRLSRAMNYVYLIASALHQALVERCGKNYWGICQSVADRSTLRNEIKKQLWLVSYEDHQGAVQQLGNDGVLVPKYKASLYDGESEVKTRIYQNNTLLSSAAGYWSDIASKYGCPPFCYECSSTSSSPDYHFRDGDLIIGGLFSVHTNKNGFNCGVISTNHGYQLTEAFSYAIRYINQKQGIFSNKLRGVTLGSVSLDICQSPLRATKLLSDTLSDSLKSFDVNVREKLVGFTGPFIASHLDEVSLLLSRFHIAQISYAFPVTEASITLFGTVPSVDGATEALGAFLKRINVSYAQVVYSDSEFGHKALELIKNVSRTSGMCIAQTISFRADDTATTGTLIGKSNAKVIVLLLDASDFPPFVEAIQKSRSPLNTYKLVALQTWTDDDESLIRLGSSVSNTIIIGVENVTVKEFDQHLARQIPDEKLASSWLKEYYEEVFGCNLSSTTSVQKRCRTPYNSLVEYPGYKQDTYAINVINSVFAIALAVHDSLSELCGENKGICLRFWAEKDHLIAKKLKLTTFQDLSGESFTFLENGFSDKAFHIYTLTIQNGRLNYHKIGSYSNKNRLSMSEFELGWDSSCGSLCHQCENVDRSRTDHASVNKPLSSNIMAFIPVHKSSTENPMTCGEIDINYGVYNMLAFFYAIDGINKDRDFSLPSSIQLGGTVVDTCENRFTIAKNAMALLSEGEVYPAQFGSRENYVGFIAMNNDDVNLLQEITKTVPSLIISPSLMPSEDSADQSFVLRTKFSEEDEGRVMAQIARRMTWLYVAIIRSFNFRTGAVQAFLEAATATRNHSGICVGLFHTMSYRSTYADALDAVDAAQKMTGINVLVLFTKPKDTRFLLRAVADLQLGDRFLFLGGTSWGDNTDLTIDLSHVAKGSIVIQSRAETLIGFDAYVKSLNLNDHGAIPREWMEEFWQRAKGCQLENATKPVVRYRSKCSPNGRLTAANMKQNSNVLYTIIATQILAIGMNGIKECIHDPTGVATCISSLPNGTRRLYESVKSATWRGQPGLFYGNNVLDFKFKNGSGNLGFSIGSIYDDGTFFGIGHYYDEYLTLDLKRYESALHFMKTKFTMKESQCPHNKLCACVRQTGQNGSVIRMTRNAHSSQVLLSTDYYSNFSTSRGLTFVVLSGAGIAVTLVLFIYLLVAYPDRGGTSVLGFLLLFAVMLIYAINFAFLLHPDAIVCDVRKCGLGFVYSLAFACMLLKVMIIWQQEDEEGFPVYRRLKHPTSLFLIAIGLSLVQAAIAVEWVLLVPSGSETVFLSDNRAIVVCSPLSAYSRDLATSCVYVMLLMFLTLVFSSMTYYSEENCQESRWILAVTILNTVVWIFWIALSCTLDYAVRDSIIIVANLANASITLLLVFIRKLYLLAKFVREDKSEAKVSGEIAFIKPNPLVAEKEIPQQPAVTFVCPSRSYNYAESVNSARTTERFYFGSQGKWDTTM